MPSILEESGIFETEGHSIRIRFDQVVAFEKVNEYTKVIFAFRGTAESAPVSKTVSSTFLEFAVKFGISYLYSGPQLERFFNSTNFIARGVKDVNGERVINTKHVLFMEPQGTNQTALHLTTGDSVNLDMSYNDAVAAVSKADDTAWRARRLVFWAVNAERQWGRREFAETEDHAIELTQQYLENNQTALTESHRLSRGFLWTSPGKAIQPNPVKVWGKVAKSLSPSQIRELLKTLFTHWEPAQKRYSYFMLQLPGPIDFGSWLSEEHDIKVDQFTEKRFYKDVEGTFSVLIGGGLHNVPRDQRYCVGVSGLKVTLPWTAAEIVSANFVTGLTMSIIAHKLCKKSESLPLLDFLPAPKEDEEARWLAPTKGQSKDFGSFVANEVSREGLLPARGILHGWTCAHELFATNQLQTVWSILQARFSWAELGEITGYGLNYVLGFVRCMRASQDLTKEGRADRLKRKYKVDDVLKALHSDSTIVQEEQSVNEFFEQIVDSDVYQYGSHEALKSYRDFLKGFQRGSVRSTATLFEDALWLGYGVGYADGFEVGYDKGFADGYRAGYDNGYAAGKQAIDAIVGAIVKNLPYIGQARDVYNFFSNVKV